MGIHIFRWISSQEVLTVCALSLLFVSRVGGAGIHATIFPAGEIPRSGLKLATILSLPPSTTMEYFG
jgi:hypothetical protein